MESAFTVLIITGWLRTSVYPQCHKVGISRKRTRVGGKGRRKGGGALNSRFIQLLPTHVVYARGILEYTAFAGMWPWEDIWPLLLLFCLVFPSRLAFHDACKQELHQPNWNYQNLFCLTLECDCFLEGRHFVRFKQVSIDSRGETDFSWPEIHLLSIWWTQPGQSCTLGLTKIYLSGKSLSCRYPFCSLKCQHLLWSIQSEVLEICFIIRACLFQAMVLLLWRHPCSLASYI